MAKRRAIIIEFLILAGFLLLPFLLFGPVTVGDRTMLPADNLFQWEPWASTADTYDAVVPQNGLVTDLIIENYAWKRFIRASLQGGELPLWNPYLFAGTPFLATGQHSAYYPFSWIFLILSLSKAYGWYTVSQLWLAGALAYFFGRTLGMRRGGAALTGLIYQGSGFMLTSAAVFPMIIGAAAWLPLLLACVEQVIGHETQEQAEKRRFTVLWVAAGGIALGLHTLAGHIEITYYTLLIMGLYAAWRLGSRLWRLRERRRMWRPAGWLLGMVLLGVMLGAIQLIPFYEVGQANFRGGETALAQVRSYAFPARRALTLAVPNFFGNPSHHTYTDVFSGEQVPFRQNYYGEPNPRGAGASAWGFKNYVEGGIYLGVLSLFLALLGVIAGLWRPWRQQQRSQTGFFLILSLVSLAFIFGTPLYALIYYGLPFADQLRTPFRWVFPLSLAAAVLAGWGAGAIERLEIREWRFGSVNLHSLISGLGVLGGLVVLAGLGFSWVAYARVAPRVERVFLGLALAPEAFPSARAFYSYEFRQFLILGGMLLGSGLILWLARRRNRIWLPLAFFLLLGDLAVANWGFNAAVDPALLEHKPELVSWLEKQPGHWRLTSFAPAGDKPFNANSGWLYDLPDVRGYDSIILKQYTAYMSAIEPQNELPFNRIQPIANWESLNSPLLDVLNVKYIITAERIDLPKLRLAWEGKALRVYENLAVAPRAYTLPLESTAVVADPLLAMQEFDPRNYVVVEEGDWRSEIPISSLQSPVSNPLTPAQIDAYGNIEVTVSAAVSSPAWLILNDTYFPGWKAFVRPAGSGEDAEQQVPISRVNGNFRGVTLEPGAWTVRFRYSPTSFQLGGLTSFMGLIILVFGLSVWSWRRLAPPGATLTATRSIAKNSAAPMALNLFNKGIDFVYAAFYLRVLGPADAGSFATAIAAAGIFDIISNFGLDILVIREVSQARDEASRYLLNTTVLRLGAALFAALPMIALVGSTNLFSNPFSQPEIVAIALIMVGMVFSGMSKGVTGLFYAHERAEAPAAMTTATTILKVAFGVVALLLGYGFVGLAAVSIITNVITFLILTGLAFHTFALDGPWRVDWRLQRRMVRLGFPLMLIHLLQTVFISVDVYLLRLMLADGERVVGWYSSAYKWFNALQIVPSFFTLALFPIISRAIQDNLERARTMYQMSLKLMLLLALPVAAVTTFLAYPLVEILGGREFLPHGAIALQLVIWSIPLGWLNSVTNYVLIALGMERMQPRAFALAVGFNIIANLLFIPRFSYVAASVTTILSELVLLLVFAYYLRRRMAGVRWDRLLARPLLVTAVMVAVMWAASQIHLALAVVLGGAVYLGGLWALRIVGDAERRILADVLPTPIATRLHLV